MGLKAEQRDAVASLLDGYDILAVLPLGFGKSLIFQGFVIAANHFSALSPTEQHQRIDFRGKKYGSFSIISCRFILGEVEICKVTATLWFSRKGAR